MSAVPRGIRLAVLDAQGCVIDTLDLEGADLRNPIGAAAIAGEVAGTIERYLTAYDEPDTDAAEQRVAEVLDADEREGIRR